MAPAVPNVILNNGCKMPVLGLGTWNSKPGEVAAAVKAAIDAGYRHFDCAMCYKNEKEIGGALKEKMQDGTVKREELFITSKLWNTFHSREIVVLTCKKSLEDLGLAYLDLYLIHWPTGFKEGEGFDPVGPDGNYIASDIDYTETWEGMQDCVDAGIVKSIGVSNFDAKQVDRILDMCKIKPVINQFECHPYLNRKELVSHCQRKTVAVTAYSPFACPNRPWAKPTDPLLLDEPAIKGIAKKYNKSPAHVLIRYQIQRDIIVIPKSVTPSQIESNFQVFDFELTKDDMAKIDNLDCNGTICPKGMFDHHPNFPFKLPK
ncbi:unnamed protein product, partial [Meganyctiphanes norvegica]